MNQSIQGNDQWLTVDDLFRIYPELEEIADGDLRRRCGEVMADAYRLGGWDREIYERCPVSLRVSGEELKKNIDHVRAVTRISLQIYDELEAVYHQDFGMRDYLAAGALLHDVGKLMEFQWEKGAVVHSASADYIRHPLGGAMIAYEHRLPNEVIHMIATHSFEGKESHRTLISQILKLADEAAFTYVLFFDREQAGES